MGYRDKLTVGDCIYLHLLVASDGSCSDVCSFAMSIICGYMYTM